MTDTVLTWMSVLLGTALCALLLWELGDVRAARRNADRRERRQAAVRAQQIRTSTQHTALPDCAEQ